MKELIQIKVEKELKRELENEAKLKGLTLAGYVRLLLIERGK